MAKQDVIELEGKVSSTVPSNSITSCLAID